MDDFKLSMHASDDKDVIKILEKGIIDFNGPALAGDRLPLNVVFKNANENVISGLSGFTNWGWLYIRLLWVSEEHRGQKLGSKLILAAEEEAKKRNCCGVWVDTFSKEARSFYESLGYSVFGELKDFPKGGQRYFLTKNI